MTSRRPSQRTIATVLIACGTAFAIGIALAVVDQPASSEEIIYEAVAGNPWGYFEEKVFRLCQRVPDDLDAVN